MDSIILKKIWHTGKFSKCHLNVEINFNVSGIRFIRWDARNKIYKLNCVFQWDITNIDDAIRIICAKIAVIQDHRLGFGFVDLKTKISEYLV